MAFFKGRHVTKITVKLGNTRVFHAYLHGFTETDHKSVHQTDKNKPKMSKTGTTILIWDLMETIPSDCNERDGAITTLPTLFVYLFETQSTSKMLEF